MTQLLKQQDGVWQITNSQPIDWSAAESFSTGSTLKLAVDVEPETAWASASLIAVDFPALTDGRGLSLAALLRQRIGYAGDLRAVGAVHEDLLHFLLRCGFSSFELNMIITKGEAKEVLLELDLSLRMNEFPLLAA